MSSQHQTLKHIHTKLSALIDHQAYIIGAPFTDKSFNQYLEWLKKEHGNKQCRLPVLGSKPITYTDFIDNILDFRDDPKYKDRYEYAERYFNYWNKYTGAITAEQFMDIVKYIVAWCGFVVVYDYSPPIISYDNLNALLEKMKQTKQ